MKTSSAKNKGRRLAAELRERLLDWAPDELKPDDIQVTPSGVTGPDLTLSPKAKEVYPLVFECKNQENINIWAALRQAESHALPLGANRKLKALPHPEVPDLPAPVLVFKRNQTGIFVTISLDRFLKLIM